MTVGRMMELLKAEEEGKTIIKVNYDADWNEYHEDEITFKDEELIQLVRDYDSRYYIKETEYKIK